MLPLFFFCFVGVFFVSLAWHNFVVFFLNSSNKTAMIEKHNTGLPANEHIDVGDESLENCAYCAGVCFESRFIN